MDMDMKQRLSKSTAGADAPCKACSDFKSWMKTQESQSQSKVEPIPDHVGKECPLDKEELGRNTWGFLHTMAAYFPDKPTETEKKEMNCLINSFSKFYPCHVCAEHFQKDVKIIPPNVNSAADFSNWLCVMHNRVNKRLGKPQFDCSKVKERWKDGWADGSCD